MCGQTRDAAQRRLCLLPRAAGRGGILPSRSMAAAMSRLGRAESGAEHQHPLAVAGNTQPDAMPRQFASR